MKTILAVALTLTAHSAVASQPVEDFSGFRVGFGASVSDISEERSKGLVDGYGAHASFDKQEASPKIEVGYDFNRVLSINGSLQKRKAEVMNGGSWVNPDNSNEWKWQKTTHHVDTLSATLEAEVGYTFGSATSWNVKPYGVVGYNSNLTAGAGVRLVSPMGLYGDVRASAQIFEEVTIKEITLTLGHKF